MARKNRQANRAAGREPSPEQKEQDEFIGELAEEDFNPDLDEIEEENDENEEEEVTEIDEKTKEREEEVSKETEPNVKTIEEEGKEAGKQSEVTSLGEEGEEGEEGDQTGVAKTPEELAEEKKKADEAEKKPEPTAAKTATEKKEEEAKPLSNEEAAKLYTEWRDETETLLAQHHYALSQEQIEEFEENPAALIPKLMSRVYMDSISAAFNQFTNYLPRMVGMVIEQRENMNAAEKAFFDKWPDLLQHRDAVLRLGMSYRQANPQASMDDFINEVGVQTMVALRLNPANGNGAANQKQQQQPAPKKAFKPAVETPSGGAPKKKEGNVFEQLADDFASFEEELDLD